jgi:hypothetical protein
MLSKCSNPACSSPFLYLRRGKLFRMETSAGYERRADFAGDGEAKRPTRRLEYFWLCEECATRMTLAFEKGVGIMTRPLTRARSASAALSG